MTTRRQFAPRGTPIEGRLLAQATKNGDCWEWAGARTPDGYGRICYEGRVHTASRLSYSVFVGPVPRELFVDHLCRNRACINPAHLRIVTNRENMMCGDTIPARNAAKTHCAKGHPYDEANTRIAPHNGTRRCRACEHIAAQTQWAKKKARRQLSA